MKKLLLLGLCLHTFSAWAQWGRTYEEVATTVYLRANDPGRLKALAEEAARSPEAYLVPIWQPAELLTVGNTKRQVREARYNVAHGLLEVQDSAGGFRVFPPGSLRGFTLGQGQQSRRFFTRLCRGTGSDREFVEVLTAEAAGPITIAFHHVFVDQPADIHPVLQVEIRKARRVVIQEVLAGAGPAAPLQPLSLAKRNVLKLFGSRAKEVETYATSNNLQYEQVQDVVRLADYYNSLK
ncbi:hypothetical protein [Hymenobacter chitinivorans]|uniref:Uncharacterized protein n=1 Tax=Hymenobacter chitinivorans DSM 11115 TaxID=1121954 RepID=A0A2M9B528_9BACT|nr:hypothetical protein [Hymenobacter chitinivorans]PJJ53049.1 hypothetical protein CLV45_3707 [Hymenobacter chitinivorans DSM 11115]